MIERTELLERIVGATPGRVLIVAGAGFGKTVLLEQIRAAHAGPTIIVRGPIADTDELSFRVEFAAAARRYGRAELSAAILGSEGDVAPIAQAAIADDCALAFDDVNLWDDAVSTFLVDLASASPQTPVILAGRRLPSPLGRLQNDHRWQIFDSGDLALTPDESLKELESQGVSDQDLAHVLSEMANGWPLALQAVASRISGSRDPAQAAQELARNNLVVDQLLQTYLAELTEQDRDAAGALALLPFFDTHLADSLGSPGLLDRLVTAGVPITFRSDGWAEIGERFRAALSRGDAPKIPSSTIEYFVDRNELHAAISSCLSVGDRESAAAIIARLDYTQQTQLEPASLNAAMTVIGDAVASAPRALLVQAQLNATFGRADEGLACLERAVELTGGFDAEPRDEGHLDILLELATWRVLFGDYETAEHLLDRYRPYVPAENYSMRARTFDLEALIAHGRGTQADMDIAIAKFAEALAIWREVGQPRITAVTVFRLADVLAGVGRSADALDLLDTLPSAGPMTALNRARLGVERAVLLPLVGRATEVPATLAEPRRLAAVLGHDWVLVWANGAEMAAASIVGDEQRLEELVSHLEDDDASAVNDLMQGYRWCDASEALARCHLFDKASQMLERARRVTSLPEWFFEYHEVSLAARSGNADHGLAVLDRLGRRDDIERQMLWSIELLTALCYWHKGDADAVSRHVAAAFSEATALGQSSLPSIVEHRVVEQLRSATPEPSEARDSITEIRLFEEFSVARNGQALTLPGGNPSHLLKLVVLNGGRLVVDQAIDPLWPDASIETGRKRLRNVLYRLREAAGDLVERSGDTIRLPGSVYSDYDRAVQAGQRALGSDASPAELAQAIDGLDRPLLPDDRYDGWAEDARAQLDQLVVELCDRQAVKAEEAGDLDLAVEALRRAHDRDPFRTDRLGRARRLLRAAGRDAAAEALR